MMRALLLPVLLVGCLLPVAAGAKAPAAGQGGEGKAAPTKRHAGGDARPEAPAEEPSLDTLREQCYGGRKRQAPPLLLNQLISEARLAALRHELDQLVDVVQKLLQAGGDEQRFIPSYGMALEERNASAHDRWKAKRCHELLRRLGRARATEGASK